MIQNIAGSRSHGPNGDDLYRDAQATEAGREWRDRHDGLQCWTLVVRRTQAEIDADFIRRSVVCGNCGLREVAEDNECSGCGEKRISKRIMTIEHERAEAEIKGDR